MQETEDFLKSWDPDTGCTQVSATSTEQFPGGFLAFGKLVPVGACEHEVTPAATDLIATLTGRIFKGPVFQHEPRIFNCWGRFMFEVTQRRGMFIPKVFLSQAAW